MDLILWRHADAESGVPDEERKLTAKGEKQAERMAAWLKENLPKDAVVLASPARRARDTAEALTKKFDAVREVGTSASAQAVLKAAGKALTDADIDPVKCDTCDPKIRLLHGRVALQPDDWSDDEFEQKNNHSIVTRVDFGMSSFLFTGDLEEAAIDRLELCFGDGGGEKQTVRYEIA